MSAKKNQQHDYFQEAVMYDLLANYYKYTDPRAHIMYYQKHIESINKAIHSTRQNMMQGGNQYTNPQVSKIRVLHAAPDSPNVDIYLDGNRILKDFPYKEASNYMSLPAGKYQIDIYPTGNMVSTVISRKVQVESGKSYTLAAAGTKENLKLVTIVDLPHAQMGGAYLRFIHLSPDVPAVDIAIKNGPVLFPNISYRQATNYFAFNPVALDFEVKQTGTNEVVISLPSMQLRPNERYTLTAVGFVQGEPGLELLVLKD